MMEFLRKVRYFIYIGTFFAFFTTSFYACFPNDTIQKGVQIFVTNTLYKAGFESSEPLQTKVKYASLWRLTGVKIEDLVVKTQKPILKAKSVKARVRLLPYVFGRLSFYSYVEAFNGNFDIDISLRKNKLNSLSINAQKINIEEIKIIDEFLSMPLLGMLTLIADINANENFASNSKGKFIFNISNGKFGPGELKIPGSFMGGIKIPETFLGKMQIDGEIINGMFNGKVFSAEGGDLEFEIVNFSIDFAEKMKDSKVSGQGSFKLKNDYIEKNQSIKTLFEILPALRNAKNSDGKVKFEIKGTLGNIRPEMKIN